MIFNQVTQENIEGNKIIKFKLNVSLKLSNHYFSPQDMMRGVQLTTSEILKLCQVKEENQVSRATKAQEDAQNMWVRAWESVMKAVILSQASPSFLLYFVIFYKHCFRCISHIINVLKLNSIYILFLISPCLRSDMSTQAYCERNIYFQEGSNVKDSSYLRVGQNQ